LSELAILNMQDYLCQTVPSCSENFRILYAWLLLSTCTYCNFCSVLYCVVHVPEHLSDKLSNLKLVTLGQNQAAEPKEEEEPYIFTVLCYDFSSVCCLTL
jgi:hypothetical protein